MKKLISIVVFIVLFFLTFSIFMGCERIDAGHVGVQVKLSGSGRGVQDVTEVTGWVFYNRFSNSIYEFPTFVQHKEYTKDDSFIINSKDGSEFHVSPVINYFVQADKVPAIFRKYRRELEEIENGFIKTVVYDAFRIAANGYRADSLVSFRENFEKKVRSILDEQLNKEGFTIQQFTSNLQYPASFKAAIEAKNNAVQSALMAENKVKQAEAEAKIKIAQAEGEAKSRVIASEGYSKSIVIEAEGKSQANKLLNQSLSQTLVNWTLANSWDGKLPVYGTTPQLFRDIAK